MKKICFKIENTILIPPCILKLLRVLGKCNYFGTRLPPWINKGWLTDSLEWLVKCMTDIGHDLLPWRLLSSRKWLIHILLNCNLLMRNQKRKHTNLSLVLRDSAQVHTGPVRVWSVLTSEYTLSYFMGADLWYYVHIFLVLNLHHTSNLDLHSTIFWTSVFVLCVVSVLFCSSPVVVYYIRLDFLSFCFLPAIIWLLPSVSMSSPVPCCHQLGVYLVCVLLSPVEGSYWFCPEFYFVALISKDPGTWWPSSIRPLSIHLPTRPLS